MQRSPWFWPLAAAARPFAAHTDWPTRDDLDGMYLAAAAGRGAEPLRFAANVDKAERRKQERVDIERLYDGRIARFGEVPTRERDWHDLLNALCFATFPHAKRALHRRQFAALARRIEPSATRLPNARTREQDALTLFDEGGAVIAARADTLAELASADEHTGTALIARAVAGGHARVVPFGHALFEHLVEGLRCPGGATRMVPIEVRGRDDDALIAEVDSALAALLEDPLQFRAPGDCAQIKLRDLGLG